MSLPDPILPQSEAPATPVENAAPVGSAAQVEPITPADSSEAAVQDGSEQPEAVFDDELDSLYYQATFLQRVGKLDEARVLYQQIQERIGGGTPGAAKSGSAADEAHRRIAEARERARAKTKAKKMSLGPNGSKRCEMAHRKALELFNAGKLQESIPHFVTVLGLDPRHAAAAANLGNAYYGCGKRDLALEWLQFALLVNPRQRSALNGMGLCVAMMGQAEESLEYFDKALAVDPQYASAYSNKGVSMVKLGWLDEALECYGRAIELDPGFQKAYENRGRLHVRAKRFGAALADFETLERLAPGTVQLEMGVALEGLGRTDEALACYDRQIDSGSRLPNTYFNKSGALKSLGRYAEAVDALRRSMQESPDQPMAYWNMSLLLLMLGEYELGWQLYEWRWKRTDFRVKERPMTRPLWRGEDLSGKTLLITEEQGLGDLIQFSRYARLACERGATVYLETHKPLAGLMQTLHPSIHILTKGPGQPLPPFDFYCPITSLPLAFGTRVDTIPAFDSYLAIDPARLRTWRERLGPSDKLRVGVVWSGNAKHVNDANRSLPLQELTGLFELDAEFHCLQKEFRAGDYDRLQDFANVHVWNTLLNDFSDTAALAGAMDVVVSVDTSVAHLSAAIGRPTWVLLPFVPDFRWLLDRGDSPWYSSVRLFRQSAGKDWAGVVAEVKKMLAYAMSGSEAAESPASEMRAPQLSAERPVAPLPGCEPALVGPGAMPVPPAAQACTAVAGPQGPCKVCGGATELYGVVDFNKNCEEKGGVYLPLSGIPVYYSRCMDCGLVATSMFDAWTPKDFADHIYNGDYVKVDPDYEQERPVRTSELVLDLAGKLGARKVLDYGAGQGLMARILRERKLDCDSWDPMVQAEPFQACERYDLVTSFEVFEHTPTPVRTAREALSVLGEQGVMLFSTLTVDRLAHRNIGFWYIAPRNGHITIHTRRSLQRLFGQLGWRVHHFSDGLHLAYRQKPAFIEP